MVPVQNIEPAHAPRIVRSYGLVGACMISSAYRPCLINCAMAFIVGNEIYDHLEKVVDRFEDVANRISGIVIEQV